MMGQLRQLIGLCMIVVAVVMSMFLLTTPSKARLAAAQDEGSRLQRQETALLSRLADAQAAQSISLALPEGYIWVGQERAALEISFQQTLVAAAESAGLRLVSFGPGRPPVDVTSTALGYDVEVEGGHEELASFLLAIENARPRLAYTYFWIRQLASGSQDGKALVAVRLGVWGFTDIAADEAIP
jgi:hypothetical protein